MSIFRCINGKNNDCDFLEKKKDYITDSVKTNGGELIGSNACLCEHGLKDWYAVKKIHHKSEGKQGEHFAVSLTPDDKSTPNDKYMELAEQIACSIFDKFNCIYAVHTDSKYRHIHLLINSVSFVDGKRYHSSKSDLATTRLKINHILEDFGFDTIHSSTDEMIDDTPYDLTEGFDCLEINDDQPCADPFQNIFADPCDDDFFDDDKPYTHVVKSRKTGIEQYDYSNYKDYDYESEDFYMLNKFNNFDYSSNLPMASPSELPADTNYNTDCNPPTPPQNYPVQSTAVNTYPNLNLNFSTTINVNVNQSVSPEQAKEYINAATPKLNTENVLKCGIAVISELQNNHINANVTLNLFPTINLNFDSVTDDSGNEIIDIE